MVYREGFIGKSTARKWFVKFKNGTFDIGNMPCGGRPSEFDKDHLKALLKEESRQTSRELAKKMNCHKKMILNHLRSIRFAKKLGVWVPMSLVKTTKKITFKLLLNISPAIEQHVVTNSAFCTKSSQEMKNDAYI